MIKRFAILLVALFAASVAPPVAATPFDDSPTLRAMKDELDRSMAKLEMPGSGKPYYLSYLLYDVRRVDVTASFGAVVRVDAQPQRSVDVDLRVGDYTFDNSNVRGDSFFTRGISLAVEDDYDDVRHDLWLGTDRYYKDGVEALERKRAVARAETKSADAVAAFSKEPPSKIVDERVLASPDPAAVAALAKKLSAVFRKNPDVQDSSVTISALQGRMAFISSEGSTSLQPVGYVRLEIECHSQADDGMPLHDGASWWAQTFDQLPSEAELLAQTERLSNELSALRKAPIVDDYAGPVLFTGVAAGQVLRALVAEQFSGTPPMKADRPGARATDSELASKIGTRILPVGVSVVDDPTTNKLGKLLLLGGGRFDEEGMPTQKVSLVENGAFKRFLMSRIPRKGFDRTNGHGASGAFTPVRAHPANLIVSAGATGLGDAALRKRAIAVAKDLGVGYVIVVDHLETRRPRDEMDPAMFRSGSAIPRPAAARRVYADGREELVRGASFGAITLRNLRDVAAVGANPTVYTYFDSGAPPQLAVAFGDRSSGGFLVSIASPALLFRDVDVKKPQGAERQPPIAPRPR